MHERQQLSVVDTVAGLCVTEGAAGAFNEASLTLLNLYETGTQSRLTGIRVDLEGECGIRIRQHRWTAEKGLEMVQGPSTIRSPLEAYVFAGQTREWQNCVRQARHTGSEKFNRAQKKATEFSLVGWLLEVQQSAHL